MNIFSSNKLNGTNKITSNGTIKFSPYTSGEFTVYYNGSGYGNVSLWNVSNVTLMSNLF